MDNSYKRRRFINYGHVCVMPLSICFSPQTVHVTCARDNDLLKLFLDTGWLPCHKKGDDANENVFRIKESNLIIFAYGGLYSDLF